MFFRKSSKSVPSEIPNSRPSEMCGAAGPVPSRGEVKKIHSTLPSAPVRQNTKKHHLRGTQLMTTSWPKCFCYMLDFPCWFEGFVKCLLENYDFLSMALTNGPIWAAKASPLERKPCKHTAFGRRTWGLKAEILLVQAPFWMYKTRRLFMG